MIAIWIKKLNNRRQFIGERGLCKNKNWVGAPVEKNRFTGMTMNCHSSLLHSEGHDLDHIQKFAHGRIPVVLQREIVIVNCNKSPNRNYGIVIFWYLRGGKCDSRNNIYMTVDEIEFCFVCMVTRFCCIACYS